MCLGDGDRLISRIPAIREFLLALLVGVTLIAAPPVQAQNNACQPSSGLVQLCDESYFLPANLAYNFPGGDPEAVKKSFDACRLANKIAGRPVLDLKTGVGTVLETRCWSCDALETIASSSQALITVLPAHLVCADGRNCAVGQELSAVMKLFVYLAVIAVIIGLGVSMLRRDPPVKELMFIGKIAIVVGLVIALGTGFAQTLWELVLSAISLSARAAIHIRNLSPGYDATEWTCQGTPQGWERAMPALYSHIQGAVELLAGYTAIIWPLMPELNLEKLGTTALTLGTNLVLDFIKIFIASTMLMGAAAVVLIYLVAVFEAQLVAAFTVALSPIIVWLALFKPTQSAAKQAFAAILYTVVLMVVIGIALAVTWVIFDIALELFLSNNLTGTQRSEDAVDNCTGQFSQFPGIWPKINTYLCINAHNLDSPNMVTYSYDKNNFVWLPPALFLIISMFFAKAVANYVQAAATEISSFGTGLGDTAKEIAGKFKKGQSMVTGGVSKIAKMF